MALNWLLCWLVNAEPFTNYSGMCEPSYAVYKQFTVTQLTGTGYWDSLQEALQIRLRFVFLWCILISPPETSIGRGVWGPLTVSTLFAWTTKRFCASCKPLTSKQTPGYATRWGYLQAYVIVPLAVLYTDEGQGASVLCSFRNWLENW